VTSPWPPREAEGASPKRVESALQPAALTAISASAIARSDDDERNNSAQEFMSSPLERNNNSLELTGRK
jgi:hypothetical protein